MLKLSTQAKFNYLKTFLYCGKMEKAKVFFSSAFKIKNSKQTFKKNYGDFSQIIERLRSILYKQIPIVLTDFESEKCQLGLSLPKKRTNYNKYERIITPTLLLFSNIQYLKTKASILVLFNHIKSFTKINIYEFTLNFGKFLEYLTELNTT